MSVTMNLSSSVIPLLMVTLSTRFNWRISFAIVGLVSCIFSYIAFTFVKDYPSDVVATLSDHTTTAAVDSAVPAEKSVEQSVTMQVFLTLLCNKFLILLSVGYLCWTFLKNGVEDWLLLYLTKEVRLSFQFSVIQIGCEAWSSFKRVEKYSRV